MSGPDEHAELGHLGAAKDATGVRHGDDEGVRLVAAEGLLQSIEAVVEALLVLIEHLRRLDLGPVVLWHFAYEGVIDVFPLVPRPVIKR